MEALDVFSLVPLPSIAVDYRAATDGNGRQWYPNGTAMDGNGRQWYGNWHLDQVTATKYLVPSTW